MNDRDGQTDEMNEAYGRTDEMDEMDEMNKTDEMEEMDEMGEIDEMNKMDKIDKTDRHTGIIHSDVSKPLNKHNHQQSNSNANAVQAARKGRLPFAYNLSTLKKTFYKVYLQFLPPWAKN